MSVAELKSIPDYVEIHACRVCGSEILRPIYSLGNHYVSDFISKEEIGTRGIKCPIELVQCNHCSLVQLKHTARQDFLYTRHYWYKSGVTTTMRKALKDIVESASKAVSLQSGDTVLDIGSNDGTLLRYYYWGLKKVGVEPATNLAKEGKEGLHTFINDFWSYDSYEKHGCQPAKVITAIGMFYDLDNPNQFIADIAQALHPEGVFIAQLMCLGNMINTCDIGNLAHEHLEFYTLQSLEYLFDSHGLEIYDVETNKTNGESYRFYVRHIGCETVKAKYPQGAAARLRYIRLQEEEFTEGFFTRFFNKVEHNRKLIRDYIFNRVAEGKKVWVYGASTKGNTIAQWLGLDHTIIEAARDLSKEKHGKYMIGTNIPIKSPEEFAAAKPAFALVLPYAFVNEFVKLEYEWREVHGGKFIVPLPELEVI